MPNSKLAWDSVRCVEQGSASEKVCSAKQKILPFAPQNEQKKTGF